MPRTAHGTGKQLPEDTLRYCQEVILGLPNIVYLLNAQCQLVAGNRNLFRLLGTASPDGLEGTLYTRLVEHTGLSPERVERLKQADIEALLSDTASMDTPEAPFVDIDGEILYFLANRIPVHDPEGNVSGLTVVLTDITERKKAAAQLEKLQDLVQQLQKPRDLHPLPPSIHRNPQKPPRVLMVEDNLIATKATQSIFLQLDCEVDVAESGEQAESLFQPGKYDIILMDIGFEDNSGYVISKHVRQAETGTGYHVPIIALTGFDAEVVREDCVYYSMEGAIHKPLSIHQARQLIDRYVLNQEVPVQGLK